MSAAILASCLENRWTNFQHCETLIWLRQETQREHRPVFQMAGLPLPALTPKKSINAEHPIPIAECQRGIVPASSTLAFPAWCQFRVPSSLSSILYPRLFAPAVVTESAGKLSQSKIKYLQVVSLQRRSSALVRDRPRYEKTIFFQKMLSRSSQIAFGKAGGWGSVWKKNVPPFSAFDLRKWPFSVFFHLFPQKKYFYFRDDGGKQQAFPGSARMRAANNRSP
jgi:hypothetical protein